MTKNRLPASFAKLTLIIIVIALTSGCAVKTSSTGKSKDSPGKEVRFTVIKSGDLGFSFIEGKTPNTYVFRTAGEWDEFWQKSIKRSVFVEGHKQKDEPIDPDPYSNELEPIEPDAEFSGQMIIGVVFERPTSGFKARITKIVEKEDEIVVFAVLEGEDAGGYENQAPYQFVRVDLKSELPVRFDIEGNKRVHSRDHVDPATHHAPSIVHPDGDHHMGEPHTGEGPDHTHDDDHHHRLDIPST